MATLNIAVTKTDGDILNAADLDVFVDSVQTAVNVDKLTNSNFASSSLEAFNFDPAIFNGAQIRRRNGAFEVYSLTEDAIENNTITSNSVQNSSVSKKLFEPRNAASTTGQVLITNSISVLNITTSAEQAIFSSVGSISTTGRLVEVMVVGQTNGSASYIGFDPAISSTDEDYEVDVRLYRNNSLIQSTVFKYDATYDSAPSAGVNSRYPPTVRFYDAPPAGLYKYDVRFSLTTGDNFDLINLAQVVREV